jgi:NAD(P)-dependent dehydrogenase (short-subunit alcohol dehydrogenase family)
MTWNDDFRGRTVLVTGGTRGVGRAVADALLAAGANVAVCARSERDLAAMRAVHPAERLLALRADVAEPDDLRRFHGEALTRFGAIHGLVNNAGTAVVGPLLDAPDALLLQHLNAKLMAYLRLSRLAAPSMARAGGGSIVHVAGAAGIDPTALTGVAGVVNAAVQNMSRMLADELADRRVRVNTVNPGTLDTDLGTQVLHGYAEQLGLDVELVRAEMRGSVPLGRIPQAADVAHAILFFLSDRSSMITGGALTPDGGILIRRMRQS